MTATTVCESVMADPSRADQAMQRVRALVESHLLALAMPATIEGITRELTAADCVLLAPHGGQPEDGIAATLAALAACGEVHKVPGGYSPQHLAADVSRRARTFTLCGRAAIACGRAVRVADVWRYANDHAAKDIEVGALNAKLLARDMSSLTNTKHLVVVGMVRGAPADGTNLVVPRHFVAAEASWVPTEPLTWLDYLADVIRRMLMHVGRDTFTAQELRAFLVQDLQERVASGKVTPEGRTTSLLLRTSLQALAASHDPLLRAVSGRRAVWRLVSAGGGPDKPADVGVPFASDADRVMAAACRVARLTSHPVVTCDQVRDELVADPALVIAGTTSVSKTMADLAKEHVASGTSRAQRKTQRVRKVGKLDGGAVYWVATGVEDEVRWESAQRFVASRGVFDDIAHACLPERITDIENAVSLTVATGRVRQLLQEVERFVERVKGLPPDTVDRADRMHELGAHAEALRGWLRFRKAHGAGAPADVQHQPVGLTAQALRALFAPINDRAASLSSNARIIQLYWAAIRRFLNPRFAGLRSGDPVTAAKFLFDQADAITYAARQWGGPTCQFHAFSASEELGDLRDVRFVLAALRSGDASVRRRVVATLALLPSPDAANVLVGHARNDVDAGVRECALWALGMVLGDQATPVLNEVAKQDPDPRVRRAAMTFLAIGDSWWWRA